MDFPLSDPSVGLVNGRFIDENPVSGQVGSIIPAAWANAIMDELLEVIEQAGLTPSEIDNTQILQALQLMFAARDNSIPIVASRPASNIGADVIYVSDQMTIMHWVTTAHYTGYRSPQSGKLEFGWTPTPLPWQVEAIGNTLNETDHGGVIARFRESGLTVALGSWVAGEYKIADMGGGEWKAPDMRDMFLRFTGTDADTADARVLGSKQLDAFKSHSHRLKTEAVAGGFGVMVFADYISANSPWAEVGQNGFNDQAADGIAVSTYNEGGTETRVKNTAFLPLINL